MPADLGASWIHGFEDNPIARLARRHAITIADAKADLMKDGQGEVDTYV